MTNVSSDKQPWLTRQVQSGAAMVFGLAFAAMLTMAPAHAQDVESFDPGGAVDQASQQASQQVDDVRQQGGAIDADLVDPSLRDAANQVPDYDPTLPAPVPVPADTASASDIVVGESGFDDEFSQYAENAPVPADQAAAQAVDPSGIGSDVNSVPPVQASSGTYGRDDLIGAAEGVFGRGAQGLAGLIEDLLREQGEPNGYIVGREGGGAFIFGVRYGSGTLHHRIEGQRKVYWTGPSVGFDAGANAGNTFVLVYNLFDTQDIFKRYPAGEGQAYFVGGLHASYMRRGDVVLIPIRVGAGLRLGVNAGYMRFSEKHRWLPF